MLPSPSSRAWAGPWGGGGAPWGVWQLEENPSPCPRALLGGPGWECRGAHWHHNEFVGCPTLSSKRWQVVRGRCGHGQGSRKDFLLEVPRARSDGCPDRSTTWTKTGHPGPAALGAAGVGLRPGKTRVPVPGAGAGAGLPAGPLLLGDSTASSGPGPVTPGPRFPALL